MPHLVAPASVVVSNSSSPKSDHIVEYVAEKFSPSYPGLKGLLKGSTASVNGSVAGPNKSVLNSVTKENKKLENNIKTKTVENLCTRNSNCTNCPLIQKTDQDENACDLKIPPSLSIDEIESLILDSRNHIKNSTLVHGEMCDDVVFKILANKGLEALREFAHESKKQLVC